MENHGTAAGKFFRNAVDKLAWALHLKGERIIRSEDQRQELIANRKAQEAAMEAYKNGKRYDDEIGWIQNIIASPSRIKDKVQMFRAFFRMGDREQREFDKLTDKEVAAAIANRRDDEIEQLTGNKFVSEIKIANGQSS